MHFKKFACVMLTFAICFAGGFAQVERSELEQISFDFAERLILDGASEEKISELYLNLSVSDKEYLEDYKKMCDMNSLMSVPSKIKKNRVQIAEKSESFSESEREEFYKIHQIKNNRCFLNMLPGFGIGSFLQGDTGGAVAQFLLDGTATVLFIASIGMRMSRGDEPRKEDYFGKKDYSYGSPEYEKYHDDHLDWKLKATYADRMVFSGAAIFFVSNLIVGTIRPAYFKSTRNKMLRSSLNLDKNGKTVAANTTKNDIQISLVPLLNPVESQYGAVAMIRF